MKDLFSARTLLLILGLAVLLRLPLLGGSFWLDEAAQALESARPLAQQFEIIPDFQPPLMHLLLHFAMYVSTSEWWLRTAGAVIPGVLSILVTYKIAKRMGISQAGLLAAILLSTSSLYIYFSQELRPYALPALWAVLSWYSLLKATDSGTKGWKAWAGYALWSSLGLYSSFLYAFLMLSQVVWMLIQHRGRLKPYLAATAAAALSFVPWLPTFQLQLAAGGVLRQDLPGWSEVVSLTQLKSLPLVLGKFVFGVVNLGSSPDIVLFTIALGVTGLLLVRQWWLKRPPKWELKAFQPELLLLLWFVVPLLAAWVVSFWIPVIQPKRVLFLMPAFYLLISLLITKFNTGWLGGIFLGLFLTINLTSTAQYYFNPQLQREDWRALQANISRKYPTNSTVTIFAFPEPFAPWRWYDQGTFKTQSLGYLVSTPLDTVSDQLKLVTDQQYLIVFDYLTDLSDPEHKMLTAIENFGFQPIEVIDYPNIGFVRVYARPGMTVSLQ